MAYDINGKTYTDHALMDEIVYNCKRILSDIVLKNDKLADNNETDLSLELSDYFISIKNGSMDFSFFPFSVDMFISYGISIENANKYYTDRNLIPEEIKDNVYEYCKQYFLDNYVEYNNYYRMLYGLPEYGTDQYNIYIDPSDSRLLEDDANTDFNFDLPIHEYTVEELNTLEALGIMDDILNTYTDKHYRYLKYLGSKRIDIYTARIAENWDILYIPNVEYLVKARFKELYQVNKTIYQRRTFQQAYDYQSDYYSETIMILALAETFTNLIVEIPEWYIRRDIFDLRTVQYFLESQGVAFYKEIPLKYQIRIVKNLNRLIKYKSTTKNIHDILDIFSVNGTKVYKYYLYKKYLYTDHKQTIIEPPKPTKWEMEDEYDFGNEDEDEFSDNPEILDFLDENESDFDLDAELHEYDFINEDADQLPTEDEVIDKEEGEEANKIIVDEYGNVYDLQFVRTPIDETYDKYLKDNTNIANYDTVTRLDEYWDGEDTHSYVKNQILKKDFTIEGTKYMFLDYSVSMTEFSYQMNYFLNLILSSKIDTNNLRISVPAIKNNANYKLSDIVLLLTCLSYAFTEKADIIEFPLKERKDPKPKFQKYKDINGGMYYDLGQPDVPEPEPEPDPEWEMENEYDFGDEETDEIKFDEIYGEMLDFGYHNDIGKDDEVHVYDFNNTYDNTPKPVEPEPEPDEPIEYDSHPYELDVFAGLVNINKKFRDDYNGGDVKYSGNITKDTYYDWLKTDHRELFIPNYGRVYGFNITVDLKEIEENISIKHSYFGFKKGYQLSDFGLDSFMTSKKIDSLEDIIKIYKQNTKCYKSLIDFINNSDTKDQLVIADYLFNSLFTVPVDFQYHSLKSGSIASNYSDLLKEKNFSLYKYYLSVMSEKDGEVRKDTIRNLLNDITNTLDFYINSDELQYVFSFVPTHSTEAIVSYIQLLINFFKSWKAYFLDPRVEYVIDDKLGGTDKSGGKADKMAEIKISNSYYDRAVQSDGLQIKVIGIFEDRELKTNIHEVIDIYQYFSPDPTDDLNYDGMYPSSYDIYVDKPDGTKAYKDLDGGSPSVNTPFIMVDGRCVADRTDVFDLDGGGPLDMHQYLSVDGLNIITDEGNHGPLYNDLTLPLDIIDGGDVGESYFENNSTIVYISGNSISEEVRISYNINNSIYNKPDGLFLGGEFASRSDYETLSDIVNNQMPDYQYTLERYKSVLDNYKNIIDVQATIDNYYADTFNNTMKVLNDYHNDITRNYVKQVNQDKTDELKDWVQNLNIGWDVLGG